MSEFEATLREALRRRAGNPGGRWMPPGTDRRVRRRQLVTAGAGAAITLVVVLLTTSLFAGLPRASQPDAVGGTSSDPFGSLPRTWPTIVAGDPADASVPPASHLLYSGTVADADFSFVAYLVDEGATGRGPCVDLTGPSTRAEQGPTVGICAHAPVGAPVPTGADLDVAGAGSSAMPDIEANFGFVSARVATLRVELSDGTTVDVPILPAIDGWIGIRPFLFFPPAGVSGSVVALSDDGTELARAPICVNEGITHSCHERVRQLEPVAVVWPEVRPDAGGAPYVDHNDIDQVIGDKIPVLHGEVITPFTGGPVAYSLVMWQSAGGEHAAGEWLVDVFMGYRLGEDPSSLRFDAVGGGFTQGLSAEALPRPVVVLGTSNLEGQNGERVVTFAGEVSGDVARLVMRADGEVREVALVPDPVTGGHRLFVAFPPLDPAGSVDGTLVALDAAGSEIWSSEIGRLFPPPPAEAGDEGWPSPTGR